MHAAEMENPGYNLWVFVSVRVYLLSTDFIIIIIWGYICMKSRYWVLLEEKDQRILTQVNLGQNIDFEGLSASRYDGAAYSIPTLPFKGN